MNWNILTLKFTSFVSSFKGPSPTLLHTAAVLPWQLLFWAQIVTENTGLLEGDLEVGMGLKEILNTFTHILN